jgi:hypothetical protein
VQSWFSTTPINDPALQTANGSYSVTLPSGTWNLKLKAYAQAPNTIYVSQSGGAYSGVGTVCPGQTTISVANFNTGSFWAATATPGKISPGALVYFCGTLASAVNVNLLKWQGSGLSGSPITFMGDTGSILQSPAFPAGASGGGINLNGQSYITFNNVTVHNTLNGTSTNTCPGGPCTSQQTSNAWNLQNSSNIVIENSTCENLYIHVSGDPITGEPDTSNINCVWANAFGSNITITHNTMHDIGWAIFFLGSQTGTAGPTITNNNIYNYVHGVAFGINATGQIAQNILIDSNQLHDTANWTDGGCSGTGCQDHIDGIHTYVQDGGTNGGTINGMQISNNWFYGTWPQNTTAALYCQGGQGGTQGVQENYSVFNNVFDVSGQSAIVGGNGAMSCYPWTGTNILANNTFIGDSTTVHQCLTIQGQAGEVLYMENNLFANCGVDILSGTGLGGPPPVLNWLVNGYESNTGPNPWQWNGVNQSTFSGFQSACACDASPSFNQSALDVNLTTYIPNGGSSAIGIGANLSSLNSGLATDSTLGGTVTPTTRPGSGVTIGARNGTGSGGGSVTLTPTTNTFPSELVGVTSPAASFTLTNTKSASLTGITPTLSVGTQFTISSNGCSSGTLGPGNVTPTSCVIQVTFTPTSLGLKTDTLSVADSDVTSPQTSALAGTGIPPSVGFPSNPLTPPGMAVR